MNRPPSPGQHCSTGRRSSAGSPDMACHGARETRESQPASGHETVRGVDYGREIELPESAARMSAAAAPPVLPRLQTESFATPVTSESKPAPAGAHATIVAPAPPVASPPAVHVAQAPAHVAQAPAHAAPAPNAPIAAAARNRDGVLEVPVRLPKGSTREIVLRIVLQIEE